MVNPGMAASVAVGSGTLFAVDRGGAGARVVLCLVVKRVFFFGHYCCVLLNTFEHVIRLT